MTVPNETDYEVGQDNVEIFGLDIHNPVFFVSGGIIVLFVFFAAIFQGPATEFFGWLRPAVTDTFDWLLIIAGNIFVIFSIALIFTPFGSIRLGGEDATPDFSYTGWFAMLFAAGMGIGLMFYGVSEPVSHFTSSFAADAGSLESWAPLGGAAGDAEAARRLGMAATIYHWGLHPWAMYAIVGLGLAFFAYNRGLPLTVRSVFYPLLGDRVWGWPGHVIDILAVFATLFGLATSLGIGAEQANAGLNHLFGLPVTDISKVLLILGITGIALFSVVAGLDAARAQSAHAVGPRGIVTLAVVVERPVGARARERSGGARALVATRGARRARAGALVEVRGIGPVVRGPRHGSVAGAAHGRRPRRHAPAMVLCDHAGAAVRALGMTRPAGRVAGGLAAVGGEGGLASGARLAADARQCEQRGSPYDCAGWPRPQHAGQEVESHEPQHTTAARAPRPRTWCETARMAIPHVASGRDLRGSRGESLAARR